MKESSTYQAALEEGRSEGRSEGRIAEARRLLLFVGTARFGPPDEPTRAAILHLVGERLRFRHSYPFPLAAATTSCWPGQHLLSILAPGPKVLESGSVGNPPSG